MKWAAHASRGRQRLRRALRLGTYAASALGAPHRESGHVLVFHTGRSGSTVLGDMLDQHSQVVSFGEVFETMLKRAARRHRHGIAGLYGHFRLNDFVSEVRKRMRLFGGSRICRVEVEGYHLEMMGSTASDVVEKLEPLGFSRFVLLRRQSTFRQIASQLVALERGAHHVGQADPLERVSVRMNPERMYIGHRFQSLDEVLSGYEAFWSSVRDALAGRIVLELIYERDIQDDPFLAYRLVCEFVGVQPESPQVRLAKTTNHPLPEIIENLEELRAYLSRHGRDELLADCEGS